MLRSMTAYGQAMIDCDEGVVECEIRSVNHRYLDIGLRLPDNLRRLDARLRERLGRVVARGKLDVSLKLQRSGGAGTGLTIDEHLLRDLAAVAARVETLSNAACVIDSVRLLQWPGVVGERPASQESVQLAAQQAFDDALTDYLATRHREGQQLAEQVRQRNQQLHDLVLRLRQHRPSVVTRQRERLQARIRSFDIDADPSRLEQEMVIAAQRLDIDEELDRLEAHCAELARALERDEPVGRRLDFLMQEFNRETNTIASKSADSLTTTLTVDMKVLIEQMREQIQNIE